MTTVPAPAPLTITHDHEAGRFEAWVEGQRCELDYRRSDGVAWFTHTGVPRDLEGRGLAARLVAAGLDWARAEGLKVKPVCSYVAVYMRRHPDTLDLLAG